MSDEQNLGNVEVDNDDSTADVTEIQGENGAAAGDGELASLRELIIRAHPDVVPELIVGETIAAMLESVGPAKDAYRSLAERIEAAAKPVTVPAGGGAAPLDPGTLSIDQKLREGLRARRDAGDVRR